MIGIAWLQNSKTSGLRLLFCKLKEYHGSHVLGESPKSWANGILMKNVAKVKMTNMHRLGR
jgi:hypothetical protein